ncbi:MAG TPA: Dps family protein [Bacteroidales bacterium]|nr:Dps family protein [Bacteroidales bacterium]
MSKLNKIGLDKDHSVELVGKLNDLLANYQVFYQNTRGFHWNIRGSKFFELHAKFEELYTDLQAKIDEIAERILTLSGTPLHTFDDYLKVSKVKAVQHVSEDEKCVESIVSAFGILLEKQRVILELSAKYDDEGTNAMASDYIRQQEKLVWMYNAWLD